ncbi:hypothetical protein A6U86_28815 [Rhizobium sp. AC27/96]|uniref:hypothetical protein n=1 Tax=Rhizobium TaxID=379 RepID=UPI000827F329|nr:MULTISPECIES: hypothetical protein [Rhizobium]NTF46634.1 hypothetical protein [Rhizobium rhizogenes]OCJ07727.1 hypothetical protein A6U86_28815 [Rhizobium sp. AC27/96]
MADNSNELIDDLAARLGVPRDVMRAALENFRDKDISDFSDQDEATVRNIVQRNIEQVLAQRGGSKGFVGGITPAVVHPALVRSRQDLLADQTVSDKVKAFVKDHCLC